ncbi:hypothetical protein [Lysobacter gummosus]
MTTDVVKPAESHGPDPAGQRQVSMSRRRERFKGRRRTRARAASPG